VAVANDEKVNEQNHLGPEILRMNQTYEAIVLNYRQGKEKKTIEMVQL
jgi:hypothetical protein